MVDPKSLSRPSHSTKRLDIGLLVLVCVSLVAFAASPARAFRLADELPSLSGHGPVRWPSSTVHFRIAGDGAPSIGLAVTSAAVQDAFRVWESIPCGPIDFRYDGGGFEAEPGDGINTITWRSEGLDGLGLAPDAIGFTDILYAEQPDGSWVIAEADIYLDGSSPHWTTDAVTDQPGLRSIPTAVAHELGHVLGILHPCEPGAATGVPDCDTDAGFLDATMYPLYLGVDQLLLGADDESAYCALYEAQACTISCSITDVCDGDRCLDPCGESLCAADEVCDAGACLPDCGGFYCTPPPECIDDADCPSGYRCGQGSCIPEISNQLGDPCVDHVDCATSICFDGYCTQWCIDSCPSGFSCVPDDAVGTNVCEAHLGVLGDPCTFGYQCTSYVCLTEHGEEEGLCSRACTSPSACPADFSCSRVDGANFCAPTVAGCSAVPGVDRSASSGAPLLFMFLLMALFRIRNRGLHEK